MRVLDFVGFGNIPGGTASQSPGASLPGTRLNNFAVTFNGAAGSWTAQAVSRPDAWFSMAPIIPGSTFIARGLDVGLQAKLANIAPDVVSTDTGITMGIRMRHGNGGSSGDWKVNGRQLSVVHATGNVVTPLITSADWDTTADGTIHYFEAVYNRATQSVKLYKNNGFLKEINLSAQVTANGRVVAFQFGVVCSQPSGAGAELSVKDIYFAEFDPAVDTVQRLGPQLSVPMPVSQVQAAWPVTVAGKTQVESLNNYQASLTTPDATPTLVQISDNDAQGLITFDSSALPANARVNSIQYAADALSTASASVLQAELMNGSTAEITKTQSFTQAFDYTKDALLNNTGRVLLLRNFPTSASGNKAAVDAYKVRLKAVAS